MRREIKIIKFFETFNSFFLLLLLLFETTSSRHQRNFPTPRSNKLLSRFVKIFSELKIRRIKKKKKISQTFPIVENCYSCSQFPIKRILRRGENSAKNLVRNFLIFYLSLFICQDFAWDVRFRPLEKTKREGGEGINKWKRKTASSKGFRDFFQWIFNYSIFATPNQPPPPST